MDDSATTPALIRTVASAAVEPRQRRALLGDAMARELAGGDIRFDDSADIHCEWDFAPLTPGLVLARGRQAGFIARRDENRLKDGDEDVSIFLGVRGVVPFEQNDRRERLHPGEALVVAHGRTVESQWPDSDFLVLRTPRDRLPKNSPIEAAGGVRLKAGSASVTLLSSYLTSMWTLLKAGVDAPPLAERHLAELTALVIDEAHGRSGETDGPGKRAACLTRMREIIARRYADPSLDMRAVAKAVGVSERTGYLRFEDAGERFTDVLYNVRLDLARERLTAGYTGTMLDLALAVGFSDLSHFNRRFRARFDMTPGDARRL